ncbi:MAG: endonuclease III [Desulfurococcales archaeon]|nr:endonuclease III [Desulfurococcales archaeon]
MCPRGSVLAKAVEILEKYYGDINPEEFIAYRAVIRSMHPFGVLVSIILTQNTSDKNALTALTNLIKLLGPRLAPQDFLKISDSELEELIRPSGMYRVKVRAIRELLKLVASDPDILTKEEPEKLRELLLSVRGIGPKTADVFLLMARGYPTFPIDTHIKRILYRLGIVERNEGYESMRSKVMQLIPKDKYLRAHLLLITHGKKVCTARRPRCSECPIEHLCRKIGVR